MRRASTILLGILLGAIAAGLGIGIVLHRANWDRERLAQQIEATVEEARAAHERDRQAIEAANQRLAQANAEVAKAQYTVKSYEEEKMLLAQATSLTAPSPRALRGWNDAIGIQLGVSLKQPSNSVVEINNDNTLILSTNDPSSNLDTRWFSLTRYNALEEQRLLATLATSTPVSYLIAGRLLTGSESVLPSQKGSVLVLRVRSNGQPTFLLWIRNPSRTPNDTTLLNVLATLRFAS